MTKQRKSDRSTAPRGVLPRGRKSSRGQGRRRAPGIKIVVTPEAVKRLGYPRAAISAQLAAWCGFKGDRDGWLEISAKELAELTGLSESTICRTACQMVKDGQIEQVRRMTPHGEVKPLYRTMLDDFGIPLDLPAAAEDDLAEEPEDPESAPEEAESSPPNLGTSRVPQDEDPFYLRDKRTNPSPTPPTGGGTEQPSLFTPESAGASSPTEKKRATKGNAPSAAAAGELESFLRSWPAKRAQRGSKPAALKAWQKRRTMGYTPDEIARQAERYHAARQIYADRWGHEPQIMNVSTFLNSKFDLFDEPWTTEDAKRYWPAPDGQSWDQKTRDRADALVEIAEPTGDEVSDEEATETLNRIFGEGQW